MYYWLGGALAVVLLLTLMLSGSGRTSARYAAAGGMAFDRFHIDPDRVPGSRSPNRSASRSTNQRTGRSATGDSRQQQKQQRTAERTKPRSAAKPAAQSAAQPTAGEWVSEARSVSRQVSRKPSDGGDASGAPQQAAASTAPKDTGGGEWVSAARPAPRKRSADSSGESASAAVSAPATTAPLFPAGVSAATAGEAEQEAALFEPGELKAKMPAIEDVNNLSSDDETAIKLELAYAYQKMGDNPGAADILKEVIKEGNRIQVKEAQQMLDSM